VIDRVKIPRPRKLFYDGIVMDNALGLNEQKSGHREIPEVAQNDAILIRLFHLRVYIGRNLPLNILLEEI
jgi:hypothetical protein